MHINQTKEGGAMMKTLKYIGWAIWIAAGLLTLWNTVNPGRPIRIATKTVANPCPEPPLPDYVVIGGKAFPNPVTKKMAPLTPEKPGEIPKFRCD
jgi:hypothetical protein